MSCSRKYKIEKNVREHRRKLRKQEKKNGGRKKSKKDPGIPNLYPFKEQTLKQLQDIKEREEEEKKRQKEARKKQHAKRRSLQGLRNDAEKRGKLFEKREKLKKLKDPDSSETLQRRTGSSYIKEFRKVVENADVLLEILDARDPLGCRCLEMEQAILASGSNKKLILVLNKIDLVPRDNVMKWLKYLRNEFPTVAFKSSTQTQRQNLACKRFPLGTGPVSMEKSSACLGSEMLMRMLGNYSRSKDIKTSITVGIVGLPNVGKSSVINSLKRRRVCTVGATAGVTKVLQQVQLDSHIALIDSPGVVMVKAIDADPRLILRNCCKIETLVDVMTPVEAILKRCDRIEIMKHYCVPSYENVSDFVTLLAKRMGKLRKGGVPDCEAAAKAVLHDWNTGRINFYTQPPEHVTSHVSADIVQEWGKVFDMPGVSDKDDDILAGLNERFENALVVTASGEDMVQEMMTDTQEEEDEASESDESYEMLEEYMLSDSESNTSLQ